jgi:hypothetical protein
MSSTWSRLAFVAVTTRGVFTAGHRQTRTARAALYAAVAYITLTTADIDVARVPLKLFVVGFALLGWLVVYRPWTQPRRTYEFGLPVLLVGIVIPLAWFVLALVLHARHDPAQPANTHYAIQQASRFVYVLLYFPIVDELRWRAAIPEARGNRVLRMHGVWLWPTLVLCVITLLFFLGHALLGFEYGNGSVGPFQGTIGLEVTGTFRAYLIDDVMLLPAVALLVGISYREPLRGWLLGVAFALLATTYVAHTRGIWLGIIISTAVILLVAGAPRPLPRGARVVAGLLGCLLVAGLVINADPAASHRIVSLVAQNELSTSYRLEQAPQLLHGFRRHVVLGSGLGATLPSGFRRGNADPWSFELTYLQLLFQLGLLGTALLLVAPALALFKGARAIAHAGPDLRIASASALGGLAGFLFTSAGNPYLMTSVGILALAVLLAMTEQAAATASVLAETHTARTAASAGGRIKIPPPLQGLPVVKRVAAIKPPRHIAVYSLAAIIGTLGVADFARSRQPRPSITASGLPQPLSLRTQSLRLPSSYLLNAEQLASATGETGASGPWSLTISNGQLLASRWHVNSGRILTDPPAPAGPAPRATSISFDIVSVGPEHPEVLGVITNLKSRIRVELRDLSRSGLNLISGDTPALPLAPHFHRDVGLAAWIGTTPDLIVVDRSSITSVIHVRVFSTISHFHHALLDVVVSKGPFPADRYAVLIGAVNSPTADLMFVTRGPTRSSYTEVHVLLGTQAFQTFGEQSAVNLPASLSHAATLVLGHEHGLAVLYAVTRASGLLRVVRLE